MDGRAERGETVLVNISWTKDEQYAVTLAGRLLPMQTLGRLRLRRASCNVIIGGRANSSNFSDLIHALASTRKGLIELPGRTRIVHGALLPSVAPRGDNDVAATTPCCRPVCTTNKSTIQSLLGA